MENLLKAAVLFLLTLMVLELMTRRRSKTRERSRKAEHSEAEVPPVSIHGYISPDPLPLASHSCDAPSTHQAGGTDKAAAIFRADITSEVSGSVSTINRHIAH